VQIGRNSKKKQINIQATNKKMLWYCWSWTVVYEALKCNSIIILLLVLLDDEMPCENMHQAKL
jgi:hypothetical protein